MVLPSFILSIICLNGLIYNEFWECEITLWISWACIELSRAPAQAVGIPYPFRDFAPLEAFLEWVRIVKLLFPKILRAGIKRFPGTPLSPSN